MDAIDAIDELQADVMRALAHPRRLQIIHILADGPCDVQAVADRLRISQPNASQHLAVMRATGVVQGVRNGRSIRYRISDPAVIEACGLMRQVLRRRLSRMGELSRRGEALAMER
jgi:ArsR family transcriptional regulator